jgi:tryptophan-rich sensory protein
MRKYLSPVAWVIAFQAVGFAIGLATSANMDWYDNLERSALTPPDIAFPIVWPILYALIALAGWRVCSQRKNIGITPIAVFTLYMVLNWGWSFVFFAGQMVAAGFFWIVALDIVALGFMALAWQRGERPAALLMIVPTLWTGFAAYLNFAIWILN